MNININQAGAAGNIQPSDPNQALQSNLQALQNSILAYQNSPNTPITQPEDLYQSYHPINFDQINYFGQILQGGKLYDSSSLSVYVQMIGVASYIQSSPPGTYSSDMLHASSDVLQQTTNLRDFL